VCVCECLRALVYHLHTYDIRSSTKARAKNVFHRESHANKVFNRESGIHTHTHTHTHIIIYYLYIIPLRGQSPPQLPPLSSCSPCQLVRQYVTSSATFAGRGIELLCQHSCSVLRKKCVVFLLMRNCACCLRVCR
jgi:hypothetical protein